MQLVQDYLEQSAERNPDKIALVCDGQRYSYAAIDTLANRLANVLLAHGVDRGDRVVLLLPNGLELAIGIFGVLKAGAVFVVLHSSMKFDKVQRIAADCGAVAMLASTRDRASAAWIKDNVPSLKRVMLMDDSGQPSGPDDPRFLRWTDLSIAASSERPHRKTIDRDLAFLVYTSGSSGVAKGVMSAHANVTFAVESITTYLENVADDVLLCALPMSFSYGLYQLFMMLQVGATLVLERSFAFPAHFLQLMEREGVTGLPGVPTLFSILLETDTSPYDCSRLRYITNAGAALNTTLISRLRERFPRAQLYSMYGLTETKRTLYLPPAELDRRPESVGIAIPGTEVWLVDEDDQRLGANQVGELVVRGGHVMRGYWNDPVGTARRFRPGPLPGEFVCYSGDLFRRDDEGFYYFVSRKDDILKCRGEKVAPKEIEEVLCRMADVFEAAVIGVPDPTLGQAIKAFVVRRTAALTDNDVLRHCRAHLEDFMIPREIVFVTELPKNANGKIQKSLLQ